MITIVSNDFCPYCRAAKQLLESWGYEYIEKIVEKWSPDFADIIQSTWILTVPQIFSGEISRENLIWGYNDLRELQAAGKLEDRLL